VTSEYGNEPSITEGDVELRTVDVHIRRLRKGLDPEGKLPELIRTVRSAGYALEEVPAGEKQSESPAD
jgi:DNA-binding response OmpR family regulator